LSKSGKAKAEWEGVREEIEFGGKRLSDIGRQGIKLLELFT